MRTHLRWSLLLLTAAVLAAAFNAGRADDEKKDEKKPAAALERKDIDGMAYKTLRDVINAGAETYNAGDVAGCWRLYEGALMMLKPMLDHRPELQKAIDDGIAGAGQNPFMDRRAWVLRGVIDKVRKETGPSSGTPGPLPVVKKDDEGKKTLPAPEKPATAKDEGKTASPVTKPSPGESTAKIWDRLGGAENVARIIDDFYQAVKDDKDVKFFRKANYVPTKEEVNTLKENMTAFISSISGGPLKYEGKGMKEAHKGMAITDKEFDAAAKDLAAALRKNGVKLDDAKEFMQKVEATRAEIVEKKDGDK